ncbi:OLC1v1036318C1 [Oldenlandia corymbosa var. corymbosa]|uniref:OLC1v1036318C1 n=1 Tax=Oldenlandia corymbosa var. corymbosa TaxID=529605 RepID=A0AAV1CV00_OLDCO|nr:OLC1v1036318C1 [Oldenlandia corymbosa var. corymbosa]
MENKSGKRFEGKVAIVTASTQGIGFSVAERLGLEGASVVISSRNQVNVEEAIGKLKAKGIEVFGVVCHVSNALQRKHLIEKTVQKYGKIDVFVSMAAVNPSVNGILEIEESILDKMWDVNVKSSILLLQEAAPHLQKGSSTALLGLTKALAAELAPNTRVNCVVPGIIPTRFAGFITSNDVVRNYFKEMTYLKRLGTTHEIAATIAFLASDDASYITGESLAAIGGYPCRL